MKTNQRKPEDVLYVELAHVLTEFRDRYPDWRTRLERCMDQFRPNEDRIGPHLYLVQCMADEEDREWLIADALAARAHP